MLCLVVSNIVYLTLTKNLVFFLLSRYCRMDGHIVLIRPKMLRMRHCIQEEKSYGCNVGDNMRIMDVLRSSALLSVQISPSSILITILEND